MRTEPPISETQTRNFPWLGKLLQLSGRGENPEDWLSQAESAAEFLRAHVRSEELVLYAKLPHVYLHAVLAPLNQLKTCNPRELESLFINSTDTWNVEFESGFSRGGRERNRVYISSPLGGSGKLLEKGEKLVFRRAEPRSGKSYTEISQRLIHALEIHFVKHLSSYCRIDEIGEFE